MTAPTITLEQKAKITEILKLLDQVPVPASLENRRHAPRLRLHVTLQAHLLSLPGAPAIQIHLRNISTRGVGFVSRRPFKSGEHLAVDIDVVPSLAKLILARVTFARYVRDGLYEIGAEFEEAVAHGAHARGYLRESLPAHWLELAAPVKPGHFARA